MSNFFISPIRVAARITTKFQVKDKLHPNGHNGIDIALPIGTPIYAPADGRVSWLPDDNDNGGKELVIKHLNGWRTGYAHLSNRSAIHDTFVKQGDLIAYSGNTGKHSTGPHLHFTVTNDKGVKVDPLLHFRFSKRGLGLFFGCVLLALGVGIFIKG